MVALAMAIAVAIAIAISVTVANSIAIAIAVVVAVAVAIANCRHRCRRPLPLRSPSTIATAISVALPSAIAIIVALAIVHCRFHHHSCHLCWPSPLPSLLAIFESCCLGAARILFEQFKRRMLTLFYFIWTVGSALIKARWLTRCRAMANTSIGLQAASSERLVREVAGSRGAARGQQGGDIDWPWEVLICCVVGILAIDRWRLWWCVGCGRRHCWWDSDWTDTKKRD